MFQDYLKENGIEESQIISINLEDLEYHFITDYIKHFKKLMIDMNLDVLIHLLNPF